MVDALPCMAEVRRADLDKVGRVREVKEGVEKAASTEKWDDEMATTLTAAAAAVAIMRGLGRRRVLCLDGFMVVDLDG